MILQNRTEKRQIGSRAGNSFSTATFAAPHVRLLPGTRIAMRHLDRLSLAVLQSFAMEHWRKETGAEQCGALCNADLAGQD